MFMPAQIVLEINTFMHYESIVKVINYILNRSIDLFKNLKNKILYYYIVGICFVLFIFRTSFNFKKTT